MKTKKIRVGKNTKVELGGIEIKSWEEYKKRVKKKP